VAAPGDYPGASPELYLVGGTPQPSISRSGSPRTLRPVDTPVSGCRTETGHAAYQVAKRLFDIVFAFVLLFSLAPIWVVSAILIRLTSPGPVIYRQVRVGEHGKTFVCLKLRTMVPDAHVQRMDIVTLNETTGPVFKIRRDPRVTRVGRFLRKLSVDEMPQLVNVIRGDMSIVGPRPPLPAEVEHYSPRQLGRLTVKPGLTCLWQVSGRSHIGFEEWVELDLRYIRRRNFWFDLWIVLRTVPAVLLARGAF
jgi:lipopolysaccharide/colanic/teichoic acid biosynthesis glycosyltransferase